MPVVFQPADPVGERIAANYGAQEQFNRTAPMIQQAHQEQARLRSAEYQTMIGAAAQMSAQSAENITRGNLAGAEMENQRFMQERRLQAAQQAQRAAFDQQREMQFTEWAMQDQRVTQAEAMRMQRQQMAIDDIVANTGEGKALTPQESAEMIMQLKTGISMTQQRMQKQHAEDYAAQAAMRQEQVKTAALNNETFRGLQLKAAQGQMSTGVILNPITGTPHWVRVDDKGNVVPMESGEQKPAETKFGDKATGEFSYKKALPEIKAEAEIAYPVVKGEDGKDTNATHRAKYTQELAKRYSEEHAKSKQGGQEVNPIQEAAQKIASNGILSPETKDQAMGALKAAQGLMAKPNKTPQDIETLKAYRAYLAPIIGQ